MTKPSFFLFFVLWIAIASPVTGTTEVTGKQDEKKGNVRRRAISGPHIGTYAATAPAPPPGPASLNAGAYTGSGPLIPGPLTPKPPTATVVQPGTPPLQIANPAPPGPAPLNTRAGSSPYVYGGTGPLIPQSSTTVARPDTVQFQISTPQNPVPQQQQDSLPASVASSFNSGPYTGTSQISGPGNAGQTNGNSGVIGQPLVFDFNVNDQPPKEVLSSQATFLNGQTMFTFATRSGQRHAGNRDDCPDESDTKVVYIETDVEKCKTDLFACIDEEIFNDPDCGCGCIIP